MDLGSALEEILKTLITVLFSPTFIPVNAALVLYIGLLIAVYIFAIPVLWGMIMGQIRISDTDAGIRKGPSVISYFHRKLNVLIKSQIYRPFIARSVVMIFFAPLLLVVWSNLVMLTVALLPIFFLFRHVVNSYAKYDQLKVETAEKTKQLSENFTKLRSELGDEDAIVYIRSVISNEAGVNELFDIEITALLKSFLQDIATKQALNNKQINTYLYLTQIFQNNVQQYNYFQVLVDKELLKLLLDTHVVLWGMLQETGDNNFRFIQQIAENVFQIYTDLFREALLCKSEKIFINVLDKHIASYRKEKSVSADGRGSRHYFAFILFQELFFKNARLFSKTNAWYSLPSSWLLTLENLQAEKEGEPGIVWPMLKSYVDWVKDLELKYNERDVSALNEVNRYWIPGVSLVAWAHALHYKLLMWRNNWAGFIDELKQAPLPTFGRVEDIVLDHQQEVVKNVINSKIVYTAQLLQEIPYLRFTTEEVDSIFNAASEAGIDLNSIFTDLLLQIKSQDS